MGMEAVYQISVLLNMVDGLTAPMRSAEGEVSGALKKMQDGFGGIQKSGAMIAGAGAAITGAALKTATATFDTQDALGELASLGVTDLQSVEQAAKNFSNTWAGTTKADFITAAYDIKSGIASLTDEGVGQFTELAALTGKATKSTTETMGSLFATGYGIYKGFYDDLSDMEFGEMFSAGISTAVRLYKTSGEGMADAISALGATATNAKVPLEEQLAILGQLQTTMEGSEAATKYSAFISAAASAGEKLGLTFLDSNNQLLSMPEILETLKGKYGETIDAVEKQELAEAFGTDEAVDLIDLLYNNIDGLKGGIEDLQESMAGGTKVTEEMAEAINNTPAGKLEVVRQQAHNLTESLGSALLPTINGTLDKVSSLISIGAEWVSANQETVNTVMNIVLYLGIFLAVAGSAAALVGTLGKVFTSLKGAISIAQVAGKLFNTTLLSSPVTWIIGAIVGLGAAFMACGGDAGEMASLFSGALSQVSTIVTDVVGMISQELPGILTTIVSAIEANAPAMMAGGMELLQSLLNGLLSVLPSLTEAGVALIQTLVSGIAQVLPGLVSTGGTLLLMLVQGIGTALPSLIDAGIALIQTLLQGLLSALPELLNAIIQLVPMILTGIASAAPSLISGGITLIGHLLTGIIEAIPAVLSMIPELFGQVVDTILSIDWLDLGNQLIGSIKDGFIEGFSSLVDSAKGLWDKFTGWLSGGGEEEPPEAVQSISESVENEVPKIESAVDGVNSALSQIAPDTSSMQAKGQEAIEAVRTGIEGGTPGASSAAAQSGEDIMAAFHLDTSGAGSAGTNLMAGVTSSITASKEEAMAAASQSGEDIMAAFHLDTGGTGMSGTDIMASVTDSITAGTPQAQAAATQAGTDLLSGLDTGTADGENVGSSLMDKVANGINANGETAVSAASGIAGRIKSAFESISITVPSPKLPHVSVSYSTVGSGDAKATVPNFAVSYYAEGGILTRPTLFGLSGNTAMVGGEAGDEAVLPLSRLWIQMRAILGDIFSKEREENGGSRQTGEALTKAITSKLDRVERPKRIQDAPKRNQGEGRGISINNLTIRVDMDKIKDLSLLFKLIDELKDAQYRTDDPDDGLEPEMA